MYKETVKEAMQCLTQGVYVIGVAGNGKENGMTAAWLTQISSRPNTLLVAIGKTHYTAQMISESRSFSVSVLGEGQDEIARTCGFASGRNTDKLANIACTYSAAGNPLIPGAVAHLDCRVDEIIPVGDHVLFAAEVIEGTVLGGTPMRYREKDFF